MFAQRHSIGSALASVDRAVRCVIGAVRIDTTAGLSPFSGELASMAAPLLL